MSKLDPLNYKPSKNLNLFGILIYFSDSNKRMWKFGTFMFEDIDEYVYVFQIRIGFYKGFCIEYKTIKK